MGDDQTLKAKKIFRMTKKDEADTGIFNLDFNVKKRTAYLALLFNFFSGKVRKYLFCLVSIIVLNFALLESCDKKSIRFVFVSSLVSYSPLNPKYEYNYP